MQKLINFQANYFKKRGEQDPTTVKYKKLSDLDSILNGEIRMDGQAQVPIHLYWASDSAHFQCLKGPEFSVLHYLCSWLHKIPRYVLALTVLSLALYMWNITFLYL